MKRYVPVALAALLFLPMLTGCRSTKEVTRKVAAVDVRKLENYLHASAPFRTLEAKVEFRVNARQGVGASMKGSIRMRRDSCVILSVQPFAGFEALKCLFVRDSLVIVSRLHQVYSVEKLSQFEYRDYVSVSALQDLLTDRIFVPGDPNPSERKINRFDRYKQKDSEGFRWAENSFILDFALDKDNRYSRLKAYRPERNEQVLVNYSQYSDEYGFDFPALLDFSADLGKKSQKVQILYLKPQFDTTVDFRFDIPSKYKKVTTSELIKRFQNLL